MKFLFFILFFLIFFTYLGYPLLLVILNAFFKKPILKIHGEPSCSLIVIVHDVEKIVRQKLDNLLSQSYPQDKLEIIIALDGCSNGMETMIREYQIKGVKFILQKLHTGKTILQEQAVKIARHEIIILSDANALLGPEAVRNIVRNFSDPSVGGVCGNLNYLAPGPSLATGESLYKKYDNWVKKLEGEIGSAVFLEGSLSAVRKDCYPEMRSEITDDVLTAMNIVEKGKRVAYETEARSFEPFELDDKVQISRRARTVNRVLHGFLLKKPLLNPLRYGFYALEIWFHKILMILVPFFLPALFFLNVPLLNEGPFFRLAFFTQCFFYAAASLYFVMKILQIANPAAFFLYLPYFFCISNLGVFLGTVKFLSHQKSVRWTPPQC